MPSNESRLSGWRSPASHTTPASYLANLLLQQDSDPVCGTLCDRDREDTHRFPAVRTQPVQDTCDFIDWNPWDTRGTGPRHVGPQLPATLASDFRDRPLGTVSHPTVRVAIRQILELWKGVQRRGTPFAKAVGGQEADLRVR